MKKMETYRDQKHRAVEQARVPRPRGGGGDGPDGAPQRGGAAARARRRDDLDVRLVALIRGLNAVIHVRPWTGAFV